MGSPPTLTITSSALLEALRDGQDIAAWEEFDRRYRPVLFHLGLRMGLDEADAADVAQESLMAFFRDHGAGRYERARGRLRAYLLGIARHRTLDALERRRRNAHAGGDTVLGTLEVPGDSELESIWDAELKAEVLRSAFLMLARTSGIDGKTLSIFQDYGLHGIPVEDVAARHGVSTSAVYAIKSRCLKRLGELRSELQTAYEDL